MGIQFTTDIGRYLGVSLCTERRSKRHFEFMTENIQHRLSSWKAKNLSLAGRCTLIQSVLSGIPSYIMQTAWLPQSTCDALNQLNRNFLWGTTVDKRKLHLLHWRKVTRPKTE